MKCPMNRKAADRDACSREDARRLNVCSNIRAVLFRPIEEDPDRVLSACQDPAARDPLWGLVRVEVAVDGATPERADLVSRWLLAERSPVSLPDPRWGAMAYGIRLTEEYLRAVTR